MVAAGLVLALLVAGPPRFGLGSSRPSSGAASSSEVQARSSSGAASPTQVLSSPAASLPPTALGDGAYPTALAAGIAAIEAATGLGYDETGCPTNKPCLSGGQVFGNADPTTGQPAGYVQVRSSASGGSVCYGYVFYDALGWHYLSAATCPREPGRNPLLGKPDRVHVPGSCAKLRQGPGLSFKVLNCLKDGTLVTIDAVAPRYVDSRIWWSIDGRSGWLAHDFLITA